MGLPAPQPSSLQSSSKWCEVFGETISEIIFSSASFPSVHPSHPQYSRTTLFDQCYFLSYLLVPAPRYPWLLMCWSEANSVWEGKGKSETIACGLLFSGHTQLLLSQIPRDAVERKSEQFLHHLQDKICRELESASSHTYHTLGPWLGERMYQRPKGWTSLQNCSQTSLKIWE